MVLRVEPEELESAAVAIEGLASQFGSDLDTQQSNVEGLDWDGASREAYITMFSEARTQFRDVEEQITNIAGALRSAKEGLIETDETIASNISGG